MKKISLLGSTGSIGVSTLDVIEKNPSLYEVVALGAGKNISLLKEQIDVFRPKVVSVQDRESADRLSNILTHDTGTTILWGEDGYCELASIPEVDVVVSAIVGAAGLLPTMEAIESGKDVALANKETLVIAGGLIMERAASKGVRILPIDSEHSAVFQCLQGHSGSNVKRIILTASGGPFLNLPDEMLSGVTVEDALKHPNWNMGRKITIDSASMMNKGLEIIEAKWLFQIDASSIDVVVHPQSIVHSMVEYVDGSVIAQMGLPDMRGPISYALSYPDRVLGGNKSLDLSKAGPLEFYEPNFKKYPALGLAYRAIREGGTMPAVLNASNEVAVEAFIAGRIAFTDMAVIIENTMKQHGPEEPKTLKDILAADNWARNMSELLVKKKRGEDRWALI